MSAVTKEPADKVPTEPARKVLAAPSPVARISRVLVLVLLLALGLAVGVVGSFLHRAEFTTGGAGWPDGLLLSLGGLVGLLLGAGELLPVLSAGASALPARLGGLACAAGGWVVAVIWLTYVGPPFSFHNKGDVVLANDWRSMTFLIVGMALATFLLYRAWIASLDAKLSRARG
jgi:hypothetical protein